ncbi:MAG TPA: glycosyl hydrolase family 8 [Polyangiaceae bacterium]|nr:glycosyl hydrolase family 8 [Polyangiaceae bacterium]
MTLARALRSLLLGAALASALSGCSGSLESLGSDAHDNGGGGGSAGSAAGSAGGAGIPSSLLPVTHPGEYYNAFSSLLGKQPQEISDKLDAAFTQLFHGKNDGSNNGANDQSFFYEDQHTADDVACNDTRKCSLISDKLHNDVRTEGLGLGMLITVELDHQKEFDELWRYSKAFRLQTTGPAAGYFDSRCGEDQPTQCFDVYGMQQFVLALMLASGRWHSSTDMPYASDALTLLDALQNQELHNGGVKGGIGSAFSANDFLVREEPSLADAGYTTRSSLQMPAAYWYWAQATGNPFWNEVAKTSRPFLSAAADPMTGLSPMRNYFDATVVEGSPGYTEQGYRTQLNLALDALWGSATADQADIANRMLDFFYSEGITKYGGSYETNGKPIETNRAQALVSVNGALAVAAPQNTHRTAFVQAVWDQPIPFGQNRYYEGLMYLMSLLILSGQLQVY